MTICMQQPQLTVIHVHIKLLLDVPDQGTGDNVS